MKNEDIRRRLINGTIFVIAHDGLDKASTKQIGLAASVNEVYIYRCFKDKADMFSKAFAAIDDELVSKALLHVPVMYIKEMDCELRCRAFFMSIWNYLIENRDKCFAYLRYYYSTYFTKYSADEHKARFEPLVKEFRPAFKYEADVWMIINHILNVMFDFAAKVHTDQMRSDDDYTEHVFRVIYHSIEQYFKK